jgi:1-aminocyclopropane-1-carboxylate deaminase/D-cysteine desulfhydrase-like pyridoxal-dependent ACC family enzyme
MQNLETLFSLWLPSPLQPFRNTATEKAGIQVFIKRDDLIHHHLSGNKYRKLRQHFEEFNAGQYGEIVAFGGAFSNLLYSLSYIIKRTGIPGTFYIRGDGFDPKNPSLATMAENGVELRFIDRKTYREKDSSRIGSKWMRKHDRNPYLVPEGGSSPLAVPGSAQIYWEITEQLGRAPDYLMMDLGTGGTFGGVMSVVTEQTRLLGIPVLKGVDWPATLSRIVEPALFRETIKRISILEDYHFGGFARFNTELIDFINRFRMEYGIPLDPVYTGKLAFALCDLLKKGVFNKGSTVVWVHSGGLQGIAGFNYLNGPLIGH